MAKHAIVAGSTGLVGRELVNLLLAHSAYDRVVTLVRTASEIRHPKLEQRVISFDRLADEAAAGFEGADVFCALGTTIKKAKTQEQFRKVDYGYPMELGRLASVSGAAQFLIVTAIGADKQSAFFYSRVKGEAEEGLRTLGLPSLHIFRPSLLLGEREEVRFGERMAALLSRAAGFAMRGPLRPYKPIAARTVAKGMLEAALRGIPGTHVYPSDRIEALASGYK
ncbi:oxidoreductase [Paenibacillus tyrfis]|uniref:Oxidoreductase n=1 Tax=Paenibacillus tyrfis TaxID=1501230 RepID=A0A081P1M1_9BACL|nr:oxidoreductase [Paenibacillus tyrfis]KEQ24594.1 oxidoreductase [Paenibacillus tyrfis]